VFFATVGVRGAIVLPTTAFVPVATVAAAGGAAATG